MARQVTRRQPLFSVHMGKRQEGTSGSFLDGGQVGRVVVLGVMSLYIKVFCKESEVFR